MATATQIGQAGEGAVVAWLQSKGFTVTKWNTQAPGATDIEATTRTVSLLVQVKAAISPSEPASLSTDEAARITSRATQTGMQAWEARVQLDASLKPLGNITFTWRRLT